MERGRRLDLAFQAAAGKLEPAQRRWLHEVAYGVVRFRGRLDHLLDLHLRGDPGQLPPEVRRLLRLGAYQLFHLDGTPAYAAVSETVEQARRVARGSFVPLVNGVLRSLAREGADPRRFPDFETDPEAHLASWGSHPAWLVRRWLDRWGGEVTRSVVEANNQIPAIHLRPVGIPLEEAGRRLRDSGLFLGNEPGAGPIPLEAWGCIRLPPNSDPSAALAVVPGVIQDPGAIRVGRLVEPVHQGPILDLCAAPGGKGLPLAGEGVFVVAADRSQRRLRLVRENRDRLGVEAGLVVADAGSPPFRPAPVVLLDVPCTGTGTFARHPDARWRLEPDAIPKLTAVQDRLLDGAAGVVEPGGVLLYTTCSLEVEENRGRVDSFLARWGNFRLESPPGIEDGCLELRPGGEGTDGAFGALMRRVE